MTLRSLLEKATDGEWRVIEHMDFVGIQRGRDGGFSVQSVHGPEQAKVTARLIVALHNCADELLRVAEAVEGLPTLIDSMRDYLLIHGDIEKNSVCLSAIALKVRADHLRAALRDLREKEGKL